MVTPEEILNELEPDVVLMERLEKQVDGALRAAARRGKWPCTFAITGEFAPVADALLAKYREAWGSRAMIFDAQRPGEEPFFQFSRPTR